MSIVVRTPLYLVTWKGGYPEQYLGRVYDNRGVAAKVCEADQMVVELHLKNAIAAPGVHCPAEQTVKTLNKYLGDRWAEELAERLEKHGAKNER